MAKYFGVKRETIYFLNPCKIYRLHANTHGPQVVESIINGNGLDSQAFIVIVYFLCVKNTLQFIRLFRYASPSSSFRCSRKRPSLLSLACASGRLSFAVGEHYYCCVYFLAAISFHVRTYADASFHITIQARSTNTRFTYVQSSTHYS